MREFLQKQTTRWNRCKSLEHHKRKMAVQGLGLRRVESTQHWIKADLKAKGERTDRAGHASMTRVEPPNEGSLCWLMRIDFTCVGGTCTLNWLRSSRREYIFMKNGHRSPDPHGQNLGRGSSVEKGFNGGHIRWLVALKPRNDPPGLQLSFVAEITPLARFSYGLFSLGLRVGAGMREKGVQPFWRLSKMLFWPWNCETVLHRHTCVGIVNFLLHRRWGSGLKGSSESGRTRCTFA